MSAPLPGGLGNSDRCSRLKISQIDGSDDVTAYLALFWLCMSSSPAEPG